MISHLANVVLFRSAFHPVIGLVFLNETMLDAARTTRDDLTAGHEQVLSPEFAQECCALGHETINFVKEFISWR